MAKALPKTLSELKSSGWKSRTVKDELRENLLQKIAKGEKQWIPMMKEFYNPFEKNLEAKYK